jgi:hypothetical protein
MVLDVQRGKLDVKSTKCLFLVYCEENKACRLMCLQTKNIVKNRYLVFIKDDINIGNVLEMRLCKKNKGLTAVIVNN